jgi:predicted transcriptional regulator of viral defense system
MKFIELKNALRTYTLFSINEIQKIDEHFHRRRLNEWQEKGYIKKIIRGYYIFSDLQLNETALFEIANKIYSPSYVSLEMALSYYNLIPESVYGITSVSTRKSCMHSTAVGDFSYRTIKPGLFFGYRLVGYDGKCFRMASLEKAVLDFFYLNTHIIDFESLRFNVEAFWEQLDGQIFYTYLERFSQKRLTKTIAHFMEFMKID